MAALPPFVPRTVALSYDGAELDALVDTHFTHCDVVGFDIEWRPTFRAGQPQHPTALIQLSSATACVLAPVAHLAVLPARLKALLEDGRVWKAGCGVTGDAAKVLADLNVRVAPLFDVAVVAPRLGDYPSPGLKGLCAAFGRPLAKAKSLSMSNWAFRPLAPRQRDYAAQDAFSSHWLVLQLHARHAEEGEALRAWLARHGSAVPHRLPAAAAGGAALPRKRLAEEAEEAVPACGAHKRLVTWVGGSGTATSKSPGRR